MNYIDVWVKNPEDGREHGTVYFGVDVDTAIDRFLDEFPQYAKMAIYAKEHKEG